MGGMPGGMHFTFNGEQGGSGGMGGIDPNDIFKMFMGGGQGGGFGSSFMGQSGGFGGFSDFGGGADRRRRTHTQGF